MTTWEEYELERHHRRVAKHRRHAYVYRVYDGWNQLLYVGFTASPHRRFIAHKCNSAWFPLMHRVEFESHPTVWVARAHEEHAIRTERPVFNYVGIRPSISWRTRRLHEAGQPCGSKACPSRRCQAARVAS